VVAMESGYEWRTEDGVVHVSQRVLLNASRNPLNVTIRSFGQGPQTVEFANAVLEQMVQHPTLSVLGGAGRSRFLI
jgi:hypothetical protein